MKLPREETASDEAPVILSRQTQDLENKSERIQKNNCDNQIQSSLSRNRERERWGLRKDKYRGNQRANVRASRAGVKETKYSNVPYPVSYLSHTIWSVLENP